MRVKYTEKFQVVKHFILVLVLTTASTDSSAATVDSETITLNSGTLQAFEILPVSNTHRVGAIHVSAF